jgi:DNA-binding beta-propeller fold protein YncE
MNSSLFTSKANNKLMDNRLKNYQKQDDDKVNNSNDYYTEKGAFLYSIGERGRGKGQFMNPQAVCSLTTSTENKLLFATDSNNQKIDAFDHDGTFQFSFTTGASLMSRIIRRPVGICCNSNNDKVYVTDYEYRCVNVFDLDGHFINRIHHKGLLGPKGICTTSENKLIIADSKANAVLIYDNNSSTLDFKINDNLAAPQYVATSTNFDKIIVSDFYNHCVKVFDSSSGQIDFNIGSKGESKGQFNGPTGVTIDSNENIVVADWGNSRIQVKLELDFY